MAIYLKRHKRILEDDDSTQGEKTASGGNAERLKALNVQLVAKDNEIRKLRTDFENKLRMAEEQRVQIKKQIADLGGAVDSNESYRSVGRKLYEAVTNKTDEMFATIMLTFDSMENLSFKPDSTRCRTFAKNIIGWLNRESDNGIGEDKFRNFVSDLIAKSRISLSNKEREEFVDKFVESLKDNVLFNWIFAEN